MQGFTGPVLIVLSGNDYTAKEFLETVGKDKAWGSVLQRANITQTTIPEADHTFSSAEWRARGEEITRQWLDKKAEQ